MRRRETLFLLAAAATAAALLTACAAAPPRMEASPTRLSQIRTIAVVRGPEPERLAVWQFSSEAAPGGAVGGAVTAALDAGVQKDRETRLTAAVQPYGKGFASHIADAVAARLNAAGYVATVQSGPPEQISDPLRFSYEKIQSSADAVLVLTPTVIGLTGAQNSRSMLPTTTLVATLLSKDRKEWLYRGYHSFGSVATANEAKWRTTPAKLVFASFDAALADPAAVSQALREAGDAVALTLAADLARK